MIYNYTCKKCNNTFILDRRIYDRDKRAKCPHCKSTRVKREFSLPGIRFIGGGFYKNDSRGK